jgi:hypothetical protein
MRSEGLRVGVDGGTVLAVPRNPNRGGAQAKRENFGVSARGLTREQSAMLAAVLPNPKGWDPTKPSPMLRWRQRRIVRRADAAQRLEKRIPRGRTVLESAGGLIKDREAGVVPLHVLGCAHAAVHVRRITGRAEPSEAHADAIEVETGRSRRRGQRSRDGLKRPVGPAALRRRLGTNRFGMIELWHRRRIDRQGTGELREGAAN